MRILDCGSGHAPLAQATHLVDKYPNSNTERRGQDLVIGDRMFTQADIQSLPFRDDSFGFVNATHVIEHTENPYKAISELKRVGRSGYVECPSLLAENLFFGSANHSHALISFLGKACFVKSTRKTQRESGEFWWKAIRASDFLLNLCHTRYYWGNGKAIRHGFNMRNYSGIKKLHFFLTFTVGDLTQALMNLIAYGVRREEISHIKSLLLNNVMIEAGGRD